MTTFFERGVRYGNALGFAAAAHYGQLRSGCGEDYINHPFRVAAFLLEKGFTGPTIEAAYLHDVLEDTDISEGYMRRHFGDATTDLVVALTRPPKQNPPNKLEAERDYMSQVVAGGPEAENVKLADIIDNMREIENMGLDWARRYVSLKKKTLTMFAAPNPSLYDAARWAVLDAAGRLSEAA